MRVLFVIFGLFVALSASAQGYKVGDKVEDFSLKNVDGKMVSLFDMAEQKGVVVIFTCNHCPYSVAYEDRIIALDKKYKSLGFPVLAINPNDPAIQPEDSFEKMIERAASKGFTFPYVFDANQSVYRKFGATKTPHVFILSKSGAELVLKYIGAIDDNSRNADKVKERYVENALDALLDGKPIEVKETKAIGCSIKDASAQ